MTVITLILTFVFLFYYSQFISRINPDLKFYYWTSNDRFSVDDQPSFDETPEGSSTLSRLYNLTRSSRRLTAALVGSGRSFLPSKNQPRIRDRYKFAVPLPPIPEDQQKVIQAAVDQEFVVTWIWLFLLLSGVRCGITTFYVQLLSGVRCGIISFYAKLLSGVRCGIITF